MSTFNGTGFGNAGEGSGGGGSITSIYNMMPDYANMETINRISTIGGTWTVDRDGFVYLESTKTSGSYNDKVNRWNVDGKDVLFTTAYEWTAILPVKAGNVIKFVSDATVTRVTCYYIPPTLNLPLPVGFIKTNMIPDYANIETINRITGGTWVGPVSGSYIFTSDSWVADRVGYVALMLDFKIDSTATLVWGAIRHVINGTSVSNIGTHTGTYCNVGVYPVNVGDTINMVCSTNQNNGTPRTIYCYYIPPIGVNPPNVVISQATYTNVEQPTGERWIDGKVIYSRTFEGGITVPSGTVYNQSLLSGVSEVIDVKGWWDVGNGIRLPAIAGGYNTTTNGYTWYAGSGYVEFVSVCIRDRTNTPYKITLYYTKV